MFILKGLGVYPRALERLTVVGLKGLLGWASDGSYTNLAFWAGNLSLACIDLPRFRYHDGRIRMGSSATHNGLPSGAAQLHSQSERAH